MPAKSERSLNPFGGGVSGKKRAELRRHRENIIARYIAIHLQTKLVCSHACKMLIEGVRERRDRDTDNELLFN